jgi:SAM domain (Sterile alpha motif)
MDLTEWLRSLGLSQYEAAFRDNEIDETALSSLTAEDLKIPVWISRARP